MPATHRVELTEADRKELQALLNSRKTPKRLYQRASIVLQASQHKSNKEIALELSINIETVARWRNRYIAAGITGIKTELPRGANHGGKNTAAQAELRTLIVTTTTQKKPENSTHWSTRTLARHLNISPSLVTRVWREVGLKPHLIKQFKLSNDPNFEEKLRDVVGLYMSPPDNAVVFCVDEKTSIQALDRSQPGLPMKKGRCGTMTHDYKRHGTSTLFAALNPANGEVIGECKAQHRTQEFLAFLKTVEKQTPADLDLHLIVDNYATHKHKKVLNWLKRNKRVHMHFIPTSSSWLNLVERFFGLLTQKQLRRGVFTSVLQLEQAIMDFIAGHNDQKNAFVWTKTAEVILEKVARARAAFI